MRNSISRKQGFKLIRILYICKVLFWIVFDSRCVDSRAQLSSVHNSRGSAERAGGRALRHTPHRSAGVCRPALQHGQGGAGGDRHQTASPKYLHRGRLLGT